MCYLIRYCSYTKRYPQAKNRTEINEKKEQMSQNLKNKIEATDISISSLLKDQKFYIDYFQREYRWQAKHIKLLTHVTHPNLKKG